MNGSDIDTLRAMEMHLGLTPRSLHTHPRLVLGMLAILLSMLIRLAHPDGNGWHFGEAFFAGMGLGFLIMEAVRKRSPRT